MKKTFLLLVMTIVLSANISFGANRTYYVSSSQGDDRNTGGIADPWQTISILNSQIFEAGDSILFKCGDVWDLDNGTGGKLKLNGTGAPESHITISSYGVGNKPLFLGSKSLTNAADWFYLGANNWATATGSFPLVRARGVGFLLIGQETQTNVGRLKKNIAELNNERDFTWDATDQRIALHSPLGNPAEAYEAIESTALDTSLQLIGNSFVDIKNLSFKYQNTYGVELDSCNNINIENIDISYMGGGVSSDWPTRSGDAIGPHGNSSFIKIKNCTISQVFDVGIAPQLYGNSAEIMHDIIIENNFIDKCGAGMGIAAHKPVQSEIYNVEFRSNTITNAGYGWSGIDNSVHGRGIAVKELYDAVNKPNVHDIKIENNIIDTYAWWGIITWEGNFIINGNIITNGLGDYSTNYNPPAAIALTGGDYVYGYSDGESTGLVSNNLIYNNKGHGIYILNNTPDPQFESLKIYNNTLYNNGGEIYSGLKTVSSSGFEFKNNIIYSIDSPCFESSKFASGKIESDYNLFHRELGTVWIWGFVEYPESSFDTYRLASGQDNNSLTSDPLFVNVAIEDLRLQNAASPAANHGIPLSEITNDFAGTPVPQGSAADIGAYEFDNCPGVDNPNQADQNNNGIGDVCDDSDNDGLTDSIELTMTLSDPNHPDTDWDTITDGADISPLDLFSPYGSGMNLALDANFLFSTNIYSVKDTLCILAWSNTLGYKANNATYTLSGGGYSVTGFLNEQGDGSYRGTIPLATLGYTGADVSVVVRLQNKNIKHKDERVIIINAD